MQWSQHSRTQVILVFCVLQIEDLRTELQRKEQELMQMQAKMKTVEEQHADYQKHIAVLKESLIAKEEHYNMLQLDVSILWKCISNLGEFQMFLSFLKMTLKLKVLGAGHVQLLISGVPDQSVFKSCKDRFREMKTKFELIFLFTNMSAVCTVGALRYLEFTKTNYTKLGTEIFYLLLRF